MAESKDPKNATEIVDALFDFVQGPEEDVSKVPIERVFSDLEKRKISADPLLRLVRTYLIAARAAEILAAARVKRERIALLMAQKSGKRTEDHATRQRLLDFLRADPSFAPAYRKFAEATETDLESLLEDLFLLKDFEDSCAE